MEETGKRTLFMSPTSFVAEIILVFMGLSGVSVIGVNVGYASILPSLFIGYGLVVGIVSTLMSVDWLVCSSLSRLSRIEILFNNIDVLRTD